MRHGCLKQQRNGRYAVAGAGRVIEPHTKCSMHSRKRDDSNMFVCSYDLATMAEKGHPLFFPTSTLHCYFPHLQYLQP